MNDDQLLRYSRHIMLPEMDVDGQEKLLRAKVVLIGLGGLGSPIALYLAAAGVGHLVLVDHDIVDRTNLQRQIVHHDATVGMKKVESAAQTLRALNPDIELTLIDRKLERAELAALVATATIVVEGTDNLEIRYLLNDVCTAAGVPWVSGAAIRFEGQVAAFDPRHADSPCYRCLYPEASEISETCAETGVIAPLVGIIGSVQALEVIKLITGIGTSLVGALLLFDAKATTWHRLKLPRNPNCEMHREAFGVANG